MAKITIKELESLTANAADRNELTAPGFSLMRLGLLDQRMCMMHGWDNTQLSEQESVGNAQRFWLCSIASDLAQFRRKSV